MFVRLAVEEEEQRASLSGDGGKGGERGEGEEIELMTTGSDPGGGAHF